MELGVLIDASPSYDSTPHHTQSTLPARTPHVTNHHNRTTTSCPQRTQAAAPRQFQRHFHHRSSMSKKGTKLSLGEFQKQIGAVDRNPLPTGPSGRTCVLLLCMVFVFGLIGS